MFKFCFKNVEDVAKRTLKPEEEIKQKLKGRTVHKDEAGNEIVEGMFAVTNKGVVAVDNPCFEKERKLNVPFGQVTSLALGKDKESVVLRTKDDTFTLRDYGKQEDAKKLIDTFNKLKAPGDSAEATITIQNLTLKVAPTK